MISGWTSIITKTPALPMFSMNPTSTQLLITLTTGINCFLINIFRMPTEKLIASVEIKEFFKELPIPLGLNGNEVNGKKYFEAFLDASKSFDDLAYITETYRRMQDFYDSLNSGRFFLAYAQRKSFPEAHSGTPPEWANDWIKAQFVNSAIHSYSASFDLFLQILWIGFELYKLFPGKCPSQLTEESLNEILEYCNINRVKTQTVILGDLICDKISAFHLSDNSKEVRNICKQIKHRQGISYSELSKDKHPILIMSDSYNSHHTLSTYSISDIIDKLKLFHKGLVELSNFIIPTVKNKLN